MGIIDKKLHQMQEQVLSGFDWPKVDLNDINVLDEIQSRLKSLEGIGEKSEDIIKAMEDFDEIWSGFNIVLSDKINETLLEDSQCIIPSFRVNFTGTNYLNQSSIAQLNLLSDKIFRNHAKLKRQWIRFNQGCYNQKYTPELILKDYFGKVFDINYRSEITVHQLIYLYGVPVMIVDQLPHKSSDGQLAQGGFLLPGVGIFIANYSPMIPTAEHELTHAVNQFFQSKKVGIFKLPGISFDDGKFYITDVVEYLKSANYPLFTFCLTRLRDEAIAYLLNDYTKYDLSRRNAQEIFESLTRFGIKHLQENLQPDQYQKIRRLCEMVWLCSKDKHKFSQNKLTQILLTEYNIDKLLAALE